MSAPSRIAGAALVAAATLAITAASHVPVTVDPSGNAMLRVAWSARPERVESCRTLSDEEFDALPQHMRQRVVCEGAAARYRLEVWRDGEPLASAEVHGGGLRRDRQLYVFRELPIPNGRSTVEVRLTRVGAATGTAAAATTPTVRADDTGHPDRDTREADEHRRRVAEEVPASLTLRETVTLAPGEVMLVTYDREERRLRAVRGAP
ncbi:MAG: hypothetical protein ACYC2G_17710 [Gemmatimonadaceae bacterium]